MAGKPILTGGAIVSGVEQTQTQEVRTLVETSNQQLIALAASLEGRLNPSEEEALANLLQAQVNLQHLVNAPPIKPGLLPDAILPADQEPTLDSITYAQTLRYAQDLVKSIRQQKEHQRRLELTSQQLIRAEKLATVGQIAATVAHELNNILTPLLMYAKLIHQETATSNAEVAEFAAQITQIAHRASDMLRQLVDASRSETPITIPIDLPKVIENALNLLSPRINKQNVRLKQTFPAHLPLVKGNPSQLEQVFINMTLNALDAMPSGGNFTITVNLENDAANEVNYLSVCMSDTGPGVPPEIVGNLFEPFFTTKARGAGAGLGLFVSYLIINQHNGAIEIDSQPGLGTTFIIKLPVMGKDET
jgi:C4-dicarboxylate-specific signal transduction histidine kinase